MRSLSTVQLATMVALLGSTAAVFIPSFLQNLHASRFAEPLEGLQHLAAHATMQSASSPSRFAYPPSAPRTPERVPAGKSQVDPLGTWGHSTWRLLGFEKTEPHFFSFEFESESADEGAHFVARAYGDLDGDGELSRFELYGETRRGQQPIVYPSVRLQREIE